MLQFSQQHVGTSPSINRCMGKVIRCMHACTSSMLTCLHAVHAWSPQCFARHKFPFKIVSCTPFRQVSKAWTIILEMGRFVRSKFSYQCVLCLAFKLCDGSQSILHYHQQIVHTMDVQVFYYCTILIRRWERHGNRVLASWHASQKAKARHVITSRLEQPHTHSGRRRFTSSLDETCSSIQAGRT